MSKKNIEYYYPLSPMQQGMLFHSLLDEKDGAYFQHLLLTTEDFEDVDAFCKGWQYIVDNQPILRTGFISEKVKEPIQVVFKDVKLPIIIEDWREIEESIQKEKLKEFMENDRKLGFNITKAPLFRIAIIRFSDKGYHILYTYHHILVDGWSLSALFMDGHNAHMSFKEGKEPTLKKRRPFRDYIAWLHKQDLNEAELFWKEYLSDFSEPTPISGISTNTEEHGYNSNIYKLSENNTQKIQDLCRQAGVTPNTFFQGLWGLLLGRYSGQDDIVYGTVVSGRPTQLKGVETTIGLFINTLPLRLKIDPNLDLKTWIGTIQKGASQRSRYEHSPLVKVQSWSELPGGQRLFDHILVFENVPVESSNTPKSNNPNSNNTPSKDSLNKAKPSNNNESKENKKPQITSKAHTSYPMTIAIYPGKQFAIKIEYSKENFTDNIIENLAKQYIDLISAFASNPMQKLSDFDLCDNKTKKILLEDWNNTTVAFNREKTVIDLFDETCKTFADKTAIVCGNRSISYKDLQHLSNAVAKKITDQQIEQNSLIGVISNRSIETIAGILGILKTGCAYVPIDPSYPIERIEYMLEDSAAKALVTSSEFLDILPKDSSAYIIETDKLEKSDLEFANISKQENRIYTIYTSGSTGKPKAASVYHKGEINLLNWYIRDFNISESDKCYLVSSLSFDLTQKNIFAPLVTGAELHLLDSDIYDPEIVARNIKNNEITLINCAPSAFYPILDSEIDDLLDSVRHIFLGGEAIKTSLLNRESILNTNVEVINTYGPTECTDVCCFYRLTSDDIRLQKNVPIGKANDNAKLYILDHQNKLAPIGAIGEIFVAGEGVGEGYLGRPELTSTVFLPDPFTNTADARMYKTGDLGRFRTDGNIDYIGRTDFQIKIRGLRIELGEIESTILKHEAVKEAIVIASKDNNDNNIIVAYFVSATTAGDANEISSRLRADIAKDLPDYMIPSAFIEIESIPLTPNGKIDRRALPNPLEYLGSSAEIIPPRNETETAIAEIWKAVLGIKDVSIYDHFFEMGGHSLLATQLASRIRQKFEIDFPLREVFDKPNIATQAEYIDSPNESSAVPLITKAPRDKEIPLSFAQQRLWFIDQLEPGNPVYNMPVVLNIEGDLDTKILEDTLNALVERHEILRTRFIQKEEATVQVIEEKVLIKLNIKEITQDTPQKSTQDSSQNCSQNKEKELITESVLHQFDLENGPLIHATLLKRSEQQYIFILNLHHIVTDGWSNNILLSDFSKIYKQISNGKKVDLPKIELHYADFSYWQQEWLSGERLNAQIDYWKNQLDGIPELLELPTDNPRPPLMTSNGKSVRIDWDSSITTLLDKITKEKGVTPFMVINAALSILLSRYSNQNDICIGTAVANRNYREIESIVGFFVNTLVMRTHVDSSQTFNQLLDNVRETSLGAYANQDLPFEKLVEIVNPARNTSHTPLFQVMLAYQNLEDTANSESGTNSLFNLSDNLKITPYSSDDRSSKFDLMVAVMRLGDNISGSLTYNTDLFHSETISRFLNHLTHTLRTFLESPNNEIRTLSLLSDEEQKEIIYSWNDTVKEIPNCSIAELFNEQVVKYPDRNAIVLNDKELTYFGLNKKANQYANFLIEQGVKQDELVGLCLNRSLELPVIILAIIKAGGAYLPVDPDYPDERIDYMLENANVKILLAEPNLLSDKKRENTKIIDINNINLSDYSETSPQISYDPYQLAYVNYTSGSTGLPKGIGINQKAVIRLVKNTNYVDISKDDMLSQMASPSFDAYTFELWGALLNGATTCMIPKVAELLPEEFAEIIERKKITIMFITTALYTYYSQKKPDTFKNLKMLAVGGERVEPSTIRAVLNEAPPKDLYNIYGPTENTTFSTWYPLNNFGENETTCPIGHPIGNSTTYILDTHLNPVPVGVVGELHVGGEGLARCYIGQQELTGEKFIPHPFCNKPGERLYKTGDLAFYNSKGAIEFVGRVDDQVKIRGFRIETGEIEAQISELPEISAVTIIVHEEGTADKRLIAYLIAEKDNDILNEISPSELRERLKEKLPDFMIPSAFIWLDEFPLNQNGKIDRKKLPSPDLNLLDSQSYIAPRNPIEEQLANIWSEVLGIEQVGINDNFFNLGGHSILATKLIARIRNELEIEIPVRELFSKPTISELYELIEKDNNDYVALPEIKTGDRPEIIPLSFAQERLWFIEQINEGSSLYNIPISLMLTGDICYQSFQKALDTIVNRHESLRTEIHSENGSPYMVINNDIKIIIEVLDISNFGNQSEKLNEIINEKSEEPFKLDSAPLAAVTLIKIEANKHALIANMHHIISDGWSVKIFIKEIFSFYGAFKSNHEINFKQLTVQYPDYAIWQRNWLQGETLDKFLSYWKNKLDKAPQLLRLPTDRPRPEVQTTNGNGILVPISDKLSQKIKQFSTENQVTTFMTLLTGFNILLSRYSKQNDICIGTPTAGRDITEIEPLIGYFVNSLIIRTKLDNNPTVKELIQEVKKNTLEAFEHQHLPLELILKELDVPRNTSHAPIAQVGFSMQTFEGTSAKEDQDNSKQNDLQIDPIQREQTTAKYDMIFALSEGKNSMSAGVEYNTDLFNEETITKLFKHYTNLLEEIVSYPEKTISSLSHTTEDELLSHFNLIQEDTHNILSLTPMQRDIYIESITNPDTTQNSMGYAFEIHSAIDLKLWQQCIDTLHNSHPILRAELVSSSRVDIDPAYLVIPKQFRRYVQVIDVENADAKKADLEKDCSSNISDLVKPYIVRPYQIDKEPLITYTLLKLHDIHWVAILSAHHIILDGISLGEHLTSFCSLYEDLSKNLSEAFSGEKLQNKNDKKEPSSFQDFIPYAQENFDNSKTITFWKDLLNETESLSFPAINNSKEIISSETTISGDHWKQIGTYCRKNKITPAIYFKNICGILLNTWCQTKENFYISEVGSGRPRGHAESIGCYYQLNPFIFRKELFGLTSRIEDLNKYSREFQKSTRQHQFLSILKQKQILPPGKLGFMFNYIGFVPDLNFLDNRETVHRFTPYPENHIQFVVNVVANNVNLHLDYQANIFEDHGFLNHMLGISEQILSGAELIGDLDLLGENEKQLLDAINQTQVERVLPHSVHSLFEKQVKQTPDATALICGDQSLTYAELNRHANQVAHSLRNQGIQPEDRVGIFIDRSVEMMVAVLATIKAGGAYLPIDAAYPPERVAHMLNDSQASFLLTRNCLTERLPEISIQLLVLDSDDFKKSIESISDNNPVSVTSTEHMLYVIYTSGSTGLPKGAAVTHANELNLLPWYTKTYEMSAADRTLVFSAFGFDLTQKNLFAPLVTGGTLVLPDMDYFDAALTAQTIKDHQITFCNCAPSPFYTIVEEAAEATDLNSLRMVLFGGEPIRMGHLSRWIEAPGFNSQIINMYGPTECTDIATAFSITDPKEWWTNNRHQVIPIGDPIENVELYVLDANQRRLPKGLVGELCIGGSGVGRGYLNNPDLTAEKFIPNPFGDGLIYRTGDLVRYLTDGSLIFMDRVDFQVKIRGQRIELGEIEAVLSALDGVNDCLVQVKNDLLIAYVIGEDNRSDWQNRLTNALPQYMIPSVFIIIEEWPLSANGKIDRNALPIPDENNLIEYVAPRNDLEKTLSRIWEELLEKSRVGINDNFFSIGGHSLLATQFTSRLKNQLDIDLQVRALFENPTISELSKVLSSESEATGIPKLEATDRNKNIPLSYAQQRLWILDQIDPNNPTYNVPLTIPLIAPKTDPKTGDVEAEIIEKALNLLIERHEGLRTTFEIVDGEPKQVIKDKLKIELQVTETSLENIQEEISKETQTGFDLKTGPLIRCKLISATDDQQNALLIINMHHIITDGWSNKILWKEFEHCYDLLKSGETPNLPEIDLQYADFAAWQRSWLKDDVLEKQLSYWKSNLDGVPSLLNLPTDHERPQIKGYDGATYKFVWPSQLSHAVETFNQKYGITPFMTFMAAYSVILAKYSNQNDVCVGTPIANRNNQDIENIVGFFVNTLVIRNSIDLSQSFGQLIESVKNNSLNAFAHQDVPFEQIVDAVNPERSTSHTPLFQVMMSYQNLSDISLKSDDPDDSTEIGVTENTSSKFDITLTLASYKNGLAGSAEFSTELFDASTIKSIVYHIKELLEQAIDDPNRPLNEFEILSASERELILHEWNKTEQEYNLEISVVDLFNEILEKNSDKEAVIAEETTLTYKELDEKSSQLANAILQLTNSKKPTIGICLERTPELIISFLAAIKTGGCYVPIDPEYPQERIEYIIDDSGLDILITEKSFFETINSTIQFIDPYNDSYTKPSDASSKAIEKQVSPDDKIYIIYTSGSTGKPKGVVLGHKGIVNLCNWHQRVYKLNSQSKTIQIAGMGFDAAGWEIWSALTSGASINLVPRDIALDPAKLQQFFDINEITHAFTPTPITERLLDLSWGKDSKLKYLLTGGDRLTKGKNKDHKFRLINNYGPTEASVVSTYHFVDEINGKNPPIGRAVDNFKLYILDDNLKPVPVGVAGELCVGGVGLAFGYHNRAELTAEQFIPNPFSNSTDERIYKTGDLVRYNRSGEIEYIGRKDFQVKIRGFRIELGEIENVLRNILRKDDSTSEVVVITRDDLGSSNELQLVGYFSSNDSDIAIQELRESMLSELPEYMVPKFLVKMDSFPITANGKIDRKNLPAPGGTDTIETEYVAPRNQTEELLCEIWCNLLGLDQVGINDNFFNLGGHSLMATKLVTQIRDQLGIDIPVKTIFSEPTIAGLAKSIENNDSDLHKMPAITHADRSKDIPLSFAQQRFWFLNQLEAEGSSTYNMPSAFKMKGDLDVETFKKAIYKLIERHDILRTTFKADGDTPRQVISEKFKGEVELLNIVGIGKLEQENIIESEINKNQRHGFDLEQGPLFTCRIIKLSENEHVLLMNMHHIISDGWSMGIVINEVKTLYRSIKDCNPHNLPEIEFQYCDYSLWQRNWLQGDVLDNQTNYWKEKLFDTPVLKLPTDRPRPPEQTFNGDLISILIDKDIAASLRNLASSQANGTTLFMTMLAAFKVLLMRYSGQNDFAVGIPIANRPISESEKLIGLFLNTLALRTPIKTNASFTDYLSEVRTTTLDAYTHQHLPFEKILDEVNVGRDMSHSPLFQVMFDLQHRDDRESLIDDIELMPLKAEYKTSKFDISMTMTDTGNMLSAGIEFNTDLFDKETIRRLSDNFTCLLKSIVETPEIPISDHNILTKDEEEKLLNEWNSTKADYNFERCIHELFIDKATASPDSTAVIWKDKELSYASLNNESNIIAKALIEKGITPGSFVGLCLNRSTKLITSIMGILKSGGAYVPIDPNYPDDRIEHMLNSSQIETIITETEILNRFEDKGLNIININDIDYSSNVSPNEIRVQVDSSYPAYMIFTSGSTGLPKGVVVRHQNVVNAYYGWESAYNLVDGVSRHLQMANVSFDVFSGDFARALCSGGTLVITPREFLLDPKSLYELIERHQIDIAEFVPAVLRQLIEHLENTNNKVDSIMCLACGSDQWTIDEYRYFKTFLNENGRIINSYGITETTIDSLYFETSGNELDAYKALPIGKPFDNITTYILDPHLQPTPVGVTGEMYIGGEGVTLGYHKQPGMTAEKFLPDPFSKTPGSLMYKSGDLAKYLANGEIELLGREDNQVKIRGFRIELGEIESRLDEHENVKHAVVIAHTNSAGQKMLVAYLSYENEKDDIATMRSFVKEQLPEHMVPSAFMWLTKFPLTPNGKIDLKSLPEPVFEAANEGDIALPTNDIEQKLVDIWQDVLGVKPIGIHDNFFHLGGDSIMSIQVVSRANQAGLSISPLLIFQNQTVAELATQAGSRSQVHADQGIIEGDLGLTPSMQYFFELPKKNIHHYNQSMLREVNEVLCPEILEETIKHLGNHHDMLRLRFSQIHSTENLTQEEKWQASFTDIEPKLEVVDLTTIDDDKIRSTLESHFSKIQTEIDIIEGPIAKFTYFNLGENRAGRLHITIHHLSIDGVSWRILFEDLLNIYNDLKNNNLSNNDLKNKIELKLPYKTTSFKYWSTKLNEYANSDKFIESEQQYWTDQLKVDNYKIPLDIEDGDNSEKSTDVVNMSLSKDLTEQLLKSVPEAYNTRIDDLLLSALGLSIHDWNGADNLSVLFEGHGREDLFEDVDLSRTIGWFTALYPVKLKLPVSDRNSIKSNSNKNNSINVSDAIKTVKEQLRKIPSSGIGYGLMRFMNEENRSQFKDDPIPEISFNYLGQLDAGAAPVENQKQLFSGAKEFSGHPFDPNEKREHVLDILGQVTSGVLNITFIFSKNLHNRETIEKLSENYKKHLTKLIEHCLAPDVGEYTPSDFEDVNLTEEELENILDQVQ